MATIPLWDEVENLDRSPAFVLRLGSPPKPRHESKHEWFKWVLTTTNKPTEKYGLESGGRFNPQLAKQFCIVQYSTPDNEPHLHHKSGLAKQPTKLVFSSEVNLMKC